MTTSLMPRFSVLEHADAIALLARTNVGRLAVSLHDRVDIQPVSYVFDDGWIYGRTRVGAKLAKLAHNPWCAFEVDEIRGMFDWESVVIHGSFHFLDPELGSADRHARAMELLEALVPGTFTADDPTPERSILFGIHVNEVTGRCARLAPSGLR